MDLIAVSRLLLFGAPETRRRLIATLLEENDPAIWRLLSESCRNDSSWVVRARCLEALGIAAASADQPTASHILGLVYAPPSDEAEGRPADPLTRREREVASLIARGLTNREIAAQLHTSPGTVRAHVQNILSKLKVPKRSAVAAWMSRNQRA